MAVTTTERIAATTAADTSYTFTVDAGASLTFTAFGLQNERITIDRYDGSGYAVMTEGSSEVSMTAQANTVKINGPFAGRINKPATINAVQVVEYA